MTKEELTVLAMKNLDEICYISDIENYEMIYLNENALKKFGITDENYIGKKCYTLLHKTDKPCDFCTNNLLSKDKFYFWEHYNFLLDQYYSLRDIEVEVDGRRARLELAVNITEKEEEIKQIKHTLSLDEARLQCIQALLIENIAENAMQKLLSIIGEYYCAKRAYIVKYDRKAMLLNNTYEWSKVGVTAKIDNLQELPHHVVDRWFKIFKEKGELYISSVHKDIAPDSIEYQILEPQGINSLIAAPILQENEIVGFIGIDDPKMHMDNTHLLKTILYFVQEALIKWQMQEELLRLSFVDSLTGLYNRNKYFSVLQNLQDNPPEHLGIVFADLNGLKNINDNYGHSYGDNFIQKVATQLEKLFPKNSYRIGGDEFVCFCTDKEKEDFDKLVKELRSHISKDELLSFSIGSIWSESDIDASSQISTADNLMYLDKQNFYRNILCGKVSPNKGTIANLLEYVKNEDFVVFLQPKVNLQDSKIIGAEALVRRKLPNGKLIFPDKFIHIYEEEGIIGHLDLFVLKTVCSMLSQWKKNGVYLPIAVNFSRVTLSEPNIVNSIIEICDIYKIEYKYIVIEVTERIGKMPHDNLVKLMAELKNVGFTFALDDFGSEYSNLLALANLDFEEIKLDKSIVDQLVHQSKNQIIMKNVINMCNSFGKTETLSEGIETTEQAEMLINFKCLRGQGYLFSKPIPMDEFYNLYEDELKKNSEMV